MNKHLLTTTLLVAASSLWPLFGADTTQKSDLPQVLLIGDSISIGYTPFVKGLLKGQARVVHHKGNAQHTGTGLEKLDSWIGETDWDVIHFASEIPPEASASGGKFIMEPSGGKAMHRSNYSAWWIPIDHKDGITYLGYLDPNLNLIVASRSSTGSWSFQDTGKNADNDPGHTQQSLAVDGDGYIHVFWGMHNHPIRYLRSKRPADITAGFVDSSSEFDRDWGSRYTYPIVATAPNGDIFLIIRVNLSFSHRIGKLFRWDNKSDKWSSIGAFASEKGYTVYPNDIKADSDGNLHIIWEWAEGGPRGSRHVGCYVKYVPRSGKWLKADGTDISSSIPLDRKGSDQYMPLQPGEKWNKHGHQSAVLQLDKSSNPLIAYSYSPDGSTSGYTHRFARWTGHSWENQVISEKVQNGYKPWMSYVTGTIRYYCGMGQTDLSILISKDSGKTWSSPKRLTNNLRVVRPIGCTDGKTDYIYMPCKGEDEDKLYLGIVSP